MNDIFKVGPENASFDGIECNDVEFVLSLARKYQKRKSAAVRDFHAAVDQARNRAKAKISNAQKEVRNALLAKLQEQAQ